jgi:hypothetical protein
MISDQPNPTLYAMVMRPFWHGLLLLGGMLLLIITLFYQVLLQEQWGLQQQSQQQITQLYEKQHSIEQHLANTPDLARIQQAMQPLQGAMLPLQQQVAVALQDKSLRVVGWLPTTQLEASATPPASQLTLHSDYYELLAFLASLLSAPQAPLLHGMTIRQGQNGVDVVISLLDQQNGVRSHQVKPLAMVNDARDPFIPINMLACRVGKADSAEFYLAGIVQSGAKQSGWLFWPDGRWQKVESGDVVWNSVWFVESVQLRQLLLRNRQVGCEQHTRVLEMGKN